MSDLNRIVLCVISLTVASSAAAQSEVLDVGPSDIPAPPAGWVSPYGAYRNVTSERAPAVTLEVAAARLDDRPAWGDFLPAAERPPRHPGEKYLEGMTIVLDPGHGGDAILTDYKRGPTGVREAAANLRVALLLADMLKQAGVDVHLTRNRDNGLSLADRAQLANDVDADFFLSLHHNAAESEDVNYTSVWLHNEYADNGPALDLARYVSLSIARHLRTDAGYTSPLMSDRQMYDSGFGVLRQTRVPALLIESSFHSNPAEEQRLRSADHNLREAYAIYEALCEYATGGRPTQTVMLEGDRIQMVLFPGLPRWWGDDRRPPMGETLTVFADGQRIGDVSYDEASRTATAALPANTSVIEVHHQNIFGHRNWPQRYTLNGESLKPLPPVRATNTDAPPNVDGPPWASLPVREPPYVLLDGGDTAAQAFVDGLDLPAGSALTVARIDPATGDLYALRHRRETRRGPQSTGDDGFPLGDLRRLPIAMAALDDPDADVRSTLTNDVPATDRLLAEVGLAGVHAFLQNLGTEKLLIRNGLVPAADLPLNADTRDPDSDGGRADWASTDDLIRAMAAVAMGPYREAVGAQRLDAALTNADGPISRSVHTFHVREITGDRTSVAYLYDAEKDRHYLVAIHAESSVVEAAANAVFEAIREGRVRL